MNHGNRVLLHASLIFLKFSVLSISGSEIKKMQYVLLRGIKVQKIDFRNIKDTVLVTLAGGCTGLTSVNLSYCDITDAGLARLAGGCAGLTSVDLFGCDKLNVTSKTSFILARGCPRLHIRDLFMPC